MVTSKGLALLTAALVVVALCLAICSLGASAWANQPSTHIVPRPDIKYTSFDYDENKTSFGVFNPDGKRRLCVAPRMPDGQASLTFQVYSCDYDEAAGPDIVGMIDKMVSSAQSERTEHGMFAGNVLTFDTLRCPVLFVRMTGNDDRAEVAYWLIE